MCFNIQYCIMLILYVYVMLEPLLYIYTMGHDIIYYSAIVIITVRFHTHTHTPALIVYNYGITKLIIFDYLY